MELAQLRYFCILAETLNYTHAAEKCYISRQALRQAIASLEDEFGIRLVENKNNRLSLTPEGRLLQTHANDVLQRVERLDRAMRSAGRDKPVEVAYSRSMSPFYAPEILHRLEMLDISFVPGIYHVQLLESDAILDKLKSGELDAGILVTMGQPMPGYNQVTLRTDPMAMLMGKNHPLAQKHQLCLADLAGQTIQLMGSPERCFSPLFEAVQSLTPPVQFCTVIDLYDVFRNAHEQNMLGLDRCDRNSDLSGNSIAREIDLPLADFPHLLYVVFLTCKRPSMPVQALLRHLQEELY